MRPSINPRGFTLISVLVAGVIAGIVIYAITGMFRLLAKQQQQSTTTTSMLSLSRNLQTYLYSVTAWKKTLNHPTNATAFSCILNSPNNCATKWNYTDSVGIDTKFVLYDQNGNSVYDGIAPTTGFTSNGNPCDTFNAADGNDSCPFQLELTWAPAKCSASPCTLPPVKVKGHFIYKPKQAARTIAFNSTNYDFNVVAGVGGDGNYTEVDNAGGVASMTCACNSTNFLKMTHIVSDTSGMYDASTGKFTPPPGRWLITASIYNSISVSANAGIEIDLYKNGSAYRTGPMGRFGDSFGYSSGASISVFVIGNGVDYYQVSVNPSNCTTVDIPLLPTNQAWIQVVGI